ncbi:MAG: acyl-CoA desaturase [Acidobacteria bacterium]|nr:acyl-CoA desaturase [Acidobacteriota bacterium]
MFLLLDHAPAVRFKRAEIAKLLQFHTISPGKVDVERSSLTKPTEINWSTAIAFSVFHIGAVAALFYFDWGAILAAGIIYWMAISWGIGMGYHRLLTHRGYIVPRGLEYFLATCGSMALEGGPLSWAGTHRIHHQNSDKEGDPHSPKHGAWWAHLWWMILGTADHNDTRRFAPYVPDLAKHRYYHWLNTYHYVPLAVSGVLLYAFGGLPYVLWGVCFRVTVGQHSTWLVNSATHMWGSRRFQTRDLSRNNWWVALLTFGEGWHNNHHAHPLSARHGLAWYEVDLTFYQIWLLEKLGVARKVKVASADEPYRHSIAA